jgi:sugar phosphate isomerase/epimerase
MEAGFSSYAMGWAVSPQPDGRRSAGIHEVLERAIALGYRRAQLADNVAPHALDDASKARLRQRARESGVTLEIGARGLTEANLDRHLELAVELDSPFVRFVIDGPAYEPDADTIATLLRGRRSQLEDNSIALVIENHDRFRATEFVHIIETADSTLVGVCLDTANSFGAGEDLYTVISLLGPHTMNVHLKDVRMRRVESQQGFIIEGTPLGEGQLPLRWALEKLAATGRCNSATLEHWVPPEARFEDTLRKEAAWCVRSTNRMRQWFPDSFSPVVR